MQRSTPFAAHGSRFEIASIPPGALFIQRDERIQVGIQRGDLRQVGFDEFYRRNLFLSDLFCHLDGRKKHQLTHAARPSGEGRV
jgi:hypothetical protein